MPATNWVIVYAGGPAETGVLRDLLEAAGIPATLGDEVMGTMAPYVIAAGFVQAIKVLVPGDRVDDARPVVEGFAGRPPEAREVGASQYTPWECPCCHERNDGTFDICWNCQTVRTENGTEN